MAPLSEPVPAAKAVGFAAISHGAAILLLAFGLGFAGLAAWPVFGQRASEIVGRPFDLAVMLALAGLALLIQESPRRRRGFPVWMASFLAAIVIAIGVVAFIGPAHGPNLSLGRSLWEMMGAPVPETNARSFAGGACLVAIGGALLALTIGRVRIAHGLALFVLAIALIGILHNTHFEPNDGPGITVYVNMRSSSALLYAVPALAILFARPRQGLLRIFAGEDAGSDVARRLVPVAIGGPIVLTWLRALGQSAGFYDEALGWALFALANIVLMLGVIWNVASTLNRLSAERRATREELVRANTELEAFAYTVAHDLRAPLRAIDGFSRALIEDYGESLEAEALRLLGVVRRNTLRMGELMDDLLSFSRLSRQPLNKQPVDPTAIVRRVVDELGERRSNRGTDILIGALPACHADPTLLNQVFFNLIGNAVKYSGKAEAPRIEIGSREDAGRTVYFVRDNGVGFDMKYASKLFGVFQRLHRAEDYEGTGVGLAIVQRIVHRHGGTIWAEARPDEGAAFFFTLDS